MKIEDQELSDIFHRMLNKALAKEMVPRKLPDGELLYRIEIHVIDAIGKHPGINLSGLAEVLCVTKGAVSQKVKILEKKEYIRRFRSPKNNKEIFFELTDKGEKVFEGHKEFHEKLNNRIYSTIGTLSKEEYKKFLTILKNIENHLETL